MPVMEVVVVVVVVLMVVVAVGEFEERLGGKI